MTFQEYNHYFQSIINTPFDEQRAPYNSADYINYTRLNWSRMNRWLKTGKLSDELKGAVHDIHTPQRWIVITEPWCGDAAHSVPFIELASAQNPLITVSYELRDSAPFRINDYLTYGGNQYLNSSFKMPQEMIWVAGDPVPKTARTYTPD